MIGNVPNWRVVHIPHGGVKDSGLRRESIHYAIRNMTEERPYEWVFVPFGVSTQHDRRKALLVRRSLKNPHEQRTISRTPNEART